MNLFGTSLDQKYQNFGGKKALIAVTVLLACTAGFFLWKTSYVLNKISGGGFLEGIVRSLPGVQNTVRGEKEGRINIALLGMRGEHVSSGGLLADTIMIISIKPAEKKASLISVPRDLYVLVPGTSDQQKINAVHFYGEERGKGQGLEAMKQILSEVSGVPIHYAISINFEGFQKIIDDLDGIDITLAEPFTEALQFDEPHVCDPNVFTVPTGTFENKIDHRGKIVASYPLCLNPDKECGGTFSLPAGQNHLNGEAALCYARSRVTSSDFERARRQQEVLKTMQKKALSLGTLTDFGRISALLDTLGDNARTDMQV